MSAGTDNTSPGANLASKEDAGKQPARRKWLVDAGVFVGMVAVGLATWHWVSPRSSPINYLLTPEPLPATPHRERPDTLDPALFTGRVAEGYRIAREKPELLERLPCYCGCYFTAGHQNNLDCFRDRHGETCDMCLSIALEAEKLARAGYGIEDIRAVINRKFAPRKRNDQ